MGASRELMETHQNGVQVWVCSQCGWKRPYPKTVPKGEDSGDSLLKEFVNHVCAHYQRGRKRSTDIHLLDN
jgi:hypothetical protein